MSRKATASLCAALAGLENAGQRRTLRLGLLRAASSRREYVAYRRRQLAVYRTLEGELDAQVASPPPSDERLEDFTSLAGAAREVWLNYAPRLRRADVVDGEVRSLGATTSPATDELFLPPSVRQYVRRIKAAATLDGDLLLGHVFARYVFGDLVVEAEAQPYLRALGFDPPDPAIDVLAPLTAAIDAAALDLDDDKQVAVYYETARAMDLQTRIAHDGRLLTLDAAVAAWKLSWAYLQGRIVH